MSVNLENKAETVKKFARGPKDTGSPEVQIALLTNRLENLSKHFSGHQNDSHSQRGMMGLVEKRKRLLSYLRREDIARYKSVIDALNIRK